MKTKFEIVTIVITVMVLFASCGGKKSIWKDINDSDTIPDQVLENIKKGKYDLNGFSQDGYTVLTKFLPSMTIDVFNACVEAGAEVNLADANGIYPLFVCFDSELQVCSKIIEDVKDINVKDHDGRNALYYLVKSSADKLYIFFKLADRKIDVSLYDEADGIWPFIDIYSNNSSNIDLIRFVLSDDFKMCTNPHALDNADGIVKESFKMIKEAQDNPLTEFSPSNKKMDPPEDAPANFLLMPGLKPYGEWAEERAKEIDHYLMCDMKLGSQTYKAGTRVVIDGYADPENADLYSYVDGVFCHDYKIHIGNDVYKIPQRYISMYASEYTFPETNETVLLLSTFAITDPNDDVYPSSFLEVYDYEFIKGVDVVLVKGNSSYKIDTSEVESGFCYNNLQIMDGSKFAASPVIHGNLFSSPVDSVEGFYYLCGNKLKKIVVTNIYHEWEDEPIYDEYIGYELNSSGNTEELLLKMRKYSEYEDYVYYPNDRYVLSAPYVWQEIKSLGI